MQNDLFAHVISSRRASSIDTRLTVIVIRLSHCESLLDASLSLSPFASCVFAIQID